MPTSSAALRTEIEASLARRIPSALTPVVRRQPELLRCADGRLNTVLGGGLPMAAISEVYGAASSGRTTLAMSLLSAVTTGGSVAAWIDVTDSMHPETAARCGVDLDRLLWVRCTAAPPASQLPTPNSTQVPGGAGYKSRTTGNGGCGSPHPRSEGNGMAQSIRTLLEAQPRSAAQHGRHQRRSIGTPGAPNRSVMAFPQASPYREEQTPTDRLPPRRSAPTSSIEQQPLPPAVASRPGLPSRTSMVGGSGWSALDHALRVTDLLLQSGGFSLLVLDLAGASKEMAWRIPLATWFRFRAACERSRSTLLVLSEQPCAHTTAERIVHMQPVEWSVQGRSVVTGVAFDTAVEKRRDSPAEKVVAFQRKPPQRESGWRVRTPWTTSA